MTPRTVSRFALALALGFAASTWAAPVVVRGKSKKSACYAGFEVDCSGGAPTLTGTKIVNGTTSGTVCTFNVQLCVNEPVSGCTQANVTGFKKNTGNLPLPSLGSAHNCGTSLSIAVPLKGKKQNKPGKKAIVSIATSDGKPKNGPAVLVLKCTKSTSAGTCGGAATTACPANSAGGGNMATVTVDNSGTDLDSGWTGTSHNFPVVGGSMLKFCPCTHPYRFIASKNESPMGRIPGGGTPTLNKPILMFLSLSCASARRAASQSR